MTTPVQIKPYISESIQMNRAKRLSNAMSLALPLALAVVLMTSTPISWVPSVFAFILAMLFFVLGSVGLGIGFHRHFTHHAFKTSTAGQALLGILGTWSLQGPLAGWVADHRRHHRFADRQFDPHSPWSNDQGMIENQWAGWWHAHMGWKLTVAVSDANRYVPDLLKDPVVMFLSRYYWWVAIAGLLMPAGLGWLYGGWDECWTCLLWAGCFRAMLLHQFEGVANSMTHLFGTKVDGSHDESRNNVFLSVMLMGEGLHSYHHQNATLAMNQPARFDAFGHVLVFFERLGLVWDLRKAKYPQNVVTSPPAAEDLSGAATI